MNFFLQLKKFRERNGLTQAQVADFLNVSKAFISTVEKGGGKLPDDKIDAIIYDSGRYGWDTSPLVPAYHTLLAAAGKAKDNPGLGRDGSNPFGLDQSTVISIRHAKQGMTETIADSIRKCCPDVDRYFLPQDSADDTRTGLTREADLATILSGISSELTQIRGLLTDIRNSIIQ